MGIGRIAVVKRGDPGLPDLAGAAAGEEIRRMATHFASDIVEGITFHDRLKGSCWLSLRRGNDVALGSARQPVIGPAEMVNRLIDLSRNNRVAIVFGPEDFGL